MVDDPPQRSGAIQATETVATAAASAVPVVGGPVAVLLQQVFQIGYGRRKAEWEADLAQAVNDLSDRFDQLPDDLASNDAFLDATAQATVAALATGQQEKREALRNAVLNAALEIDIALDVQAMFIRHIRDFTPTHLRLLRVLDDPKGWFAQRGIPWPENIMAGGLGNTVIEAGIPELKGRREFYDQIGNDLSAAGMLNTGGFHATMSASGLEARRTTATGQQFLRFITDPRDDDAGDES